MKVWFNVTNVGNGTASSPFGGWYDQVTLSTNTALAGKLSSWEWFRFGTEAAGAVYTLTNAVTLPTLASGTYYLIVQTDDRNYVRSEERRVGKERRSRWAPYH